LILYRYIASEIIKTKLAVLMVIILIFLSQRFVQFIAKAAAGKIEVSAVVDMLWLQMPVLVAFLLPLAIFLATLLTIGRMYVDHEFAIVKACGISEIQLAKKLFVPLIILAGLTTYLTFYIAPQADLAQYQLLDKQKAQSQVGLLSSGQFKKTKDKRGTFYVQSIDDKKNMQEIFYALKEKNSDKYTLVTAKKGSIVDTEDGKALVLSQGQQYQGEMASQELTLTKFERYILRLPEPKVEQRKYKLKAIDSATLFQNSDSASAAELQWRMAIPLSLVILTLIAIPMARVRPRQGKFAKLIPAIMVYMFYMVGLLGGKSLIESGKLPTVPGLYLVHFIFAALAGYLYWKESRTWQRFVVKRGEQ